MLEVIKKIFPLFPQISLAVIFLEYNRPENGPSETAFITLQNYLAKIPNCHITYLRVDNKNEKAFIQNTSKNIYTIGGDNTFNEFSGWQKGFINLTTHNIRSDLILFVNDMFLSPGESFLKDYASIELLCKSLIHDCIIGRIDSTNQQFTIYDYDVSQWVCTNCFLAPRKAIETIKDLVSIKDSLDDFLPSAYPISAGKTLNQEKLALHLFKEDAPLNNTYKLWLVEWLTKRWHSKFEINERTWVLFRTKVRNILNESLLTARLKRAGFPPQAYGNKKYY